MKLATFNVNGVNGRLPVLLRWLEEAAPDEVVEAVGASPLMAKSTARRGTTPAFSS